MAAKALAAHECAALFPLLSKDDFESLKADIAEHGLRFPIIVHDGQILDGRNRYRACAELQITPQTQPLPKGKSPTAFVISANRHRRHLTKGQQAAVAVDAEPLFAKEAKERQKAGGKKAGRSRPSSEKGAPKLGEPIANGEALKQAAKSVGVSHGYASDAKAIKAKDPKVFEQVKSGEVTLQQAKRQLTPPKPPPKTPGLDSVNKWLPDVAGFLARIVNEYGDWGQLAKKEKWSDDDKMMIRGSLAGLRRDLLKCEKDLT